MNKTKPVGFNLEKVVTRTISNKGLEFQGGWLFEKSIAEMTEKAFLGFSQLTRYEHKSELELYEKSEFEAMNYQLYFQKLG